MNTVFLKLLNMSIRAGWSVLAILIMRPLFTRVSRRISCTLWLFVALRLICPLSIKCFSSLIPDIRIHPEDITVARLLSGNNNLLYPDIISDPMQIIISICTAVWFIGTTAMLTYALIGYLRIRQNVREAVLIGNSVWMCDHIATPFLMGIFHPRIYLPSTTTATDSKYVIFHENMHLKYHDHISKPLAFLLLAVYWFNPIIWIAYILMCKDIEIACDEQIIRELGTDAKKPYAQALINCSAPHKTPAACPLAFGEVTIKERVKRVLNYQKPAPPLTVAALIICVVTALFLVTNPIYSEETMLHHQTLTQTATKENTTYVEFRDYQVNTDRTYSCNGHTFKYQMEVSNMIQEKPSTFVILSNSPNVTFEDALYYFASSDSKLSGNFMVVGWYLYDTP